MDRTNLPSNRLQSWGKESQKFPAILFVLSRLHAYNKGRKNDRRYHFLIQLKRACKLWKTYTEITLSKERFNWCLHQKKSENVHPNNGSKCLPTEVFGERTRDPASRSYAWNSVWRNETQEVPLWDFLFYVIFITFFIEKIISTGALLQTQGQEYDGIRNHKLQRNECQNSMDHWVKDYNPSFHWGISLFFWSILNWILPGKMRANERSLSNGIGDQRLRNVKAIKKALFLYKDSVKMMIWIKNSNCCKSII